MTRPDDIPRYVWDAADAAFERGCVTGAPAQEIIARSILAERERCASVVEKYRYEHKWLRDIFAALIRKGGQP